MVSYKVEQGAAITEEEKRELEEAKKRPVLFDEDSPGLDPNRRLSKREKRNPMLQSPLPYTFLWRRLKKRKL